MDTHTTEDRSLGLNSSVSRSRGESLCDHSAIELTDDTVMAGLGSLPPLHRIFRRHRIETTQVDQNQ